MLVLLLHTPMGVYILSVLLLLYTFYTKCVGFYVFKKRGGGVCASLCYILGCVPGIYIYVSAITLEGVCPC